LSENPAPMIRPLGENWTLGKSGPDGSVYVCSKVPSAIRNILIEQSMQLLYVGSLYATPAATSVPFGANAIESVVIGFG